MTQGMYRNSCSLEFDLYEDILMMIMIQVKLPIPLLSCWNDDYLKAIGNGLGKYLDRAEPKGQQFSCANIYVEVELEKGFPYEIKLTQGP